MIRDVRFYTYVNSGWKPLSPNSDFPYVVNLFRFVHGGCPIQRVHRKELSCRIYGAKCLVLPFLLPVMSVICLFVINSMETRSIKLL